MGRISRSAETWRAIANLAGDQHGVIGRKQLLALGLSDGAIEGAVSNFHLHRVLRGVYAVGSANVSERGFLHAAALACGDAAALSHRAAAFLLGLIDTCPRVIDVIAPASVGRGISRVKWHCVRPPSGEELGTVDGVPCTSPSRTIVDLAGMLGERSLSRAVERAATLDLLDVAAIERALTPRRRGAPALRRVLAPWRPEGEGTDEAAKRRRLRSDFEARVLAMTRRFGFPAPLANHSVRLAEGTPEVDLLWPDARLAVELDSRRHHAHLAAFERDRWRDRQLVTAGYRVVRVTWRQLEGEPEAISSRRSVRCSSRRPAFASVNAMAVRTQEIRLSTEGDSDVLDLTEAAARAVAEAEVSEGQLLAFVRGSTAAISTMELEPGGVRDLREMLERLIPAAGEYEHNRLNGDTNSHAHQRATVVGASQAIPVVGGRLALGTWQQLVLIDFDDRPRERTIVLQVSG